MLNLIFSKFIMAIVILVFIYGHNLYAGYNDIDLLINKAKKNNPTILSTKSNYTSILHKVRQAGALPDPQITAGIFGERIQTKTGYLKGASRNSNFSGGLNYSIN